MRAATLLIGVLALATVGSAAQRAVDGPTAINAWSDTAGPDGQTWHLQLNRDRRATVTAYSGPGSKSAERRFRVSIDQYAAIMRVADETRFFALPEWIGPSAIPLHGPENVLRIGMAGRAHQVTLHDPHSAKGDDAARFQRVWRAVVSSSPAKPPL
jgi:hypothetical protein